MTTFVSPDLDAASWEALEPLLEELRTREVGSPEEFERWLLDRSELDAACSEAGAMRYIATTRRTDDESASAAYLAFVERVEPRLKPASFALDRRQAELQDRFRLDPDRYLVLDRDTRADVALFREENVAIETELARLAQRYEQISGAMTVAFEGQEKTLPQMARYLEEPDRALRERAWRAVSERRAQDGEALDTLFDEMVAKRDAIASNAGFTSYLEYGFRRKHRFDYTARDCAVFHDSCASEVVPLLREMDASRRAALGVDALRPWDLAVDPKGRPALRPFEGADELVDKCQRMFDRMGAGLGALFAELREGDSLDLESRRAKAPGGYQYMRDRSRRPFIFMNAAGMHADVKTMVHEAGHAFHSALCRDEPLLHYRHATNEFSEVASMSMELLSMPYWDEFYPDPADLARARRDHLERIVAILPWIATVDAFQAWVYTNPGHTREQRADEWERLTDRLGHDVDWGGLRGAKRSGWHRQLHIFTVPLYYIEYAIAQLGALQLWLISKREGEARALELYRSGLTLGGSRPLPELFAATGLRFDFSRAAVAELIGAVRSELEGLAE